MARKGQESRAQALVDELVGDIQKVSKLSELKLTCDLTGEEGKLSQLAREFVKVKSERDKLKPTQLRRIFHDLKRVEQNFRRRRYDSSQVQLELALTLPELAYALGREVIPSPFYNLMKELLQPQRIQDEQDLRRLVEILTVLLAYHKYHEKVKEPEQSQGGEA